MQSIPTNAIRIVQQKLGQEGFDPGPADGYLGAKTEQALDAFLSQHRDELASAYVDDILGRSRKRKLTAFIQLLAHGSGIEVGLIDGFWGPQTDYAFDELEYQLEFGEQAHAWRDYSGPDNNPHQWPDDSQSALAEFYGEPAHPPLVQVELPYALRLSWNLNQVVRKISCHEKVADSVHRVLSAVLDHYGEERIRELRLDRYGGSFNARKKRGGSTWSTHAWGIALDFDPGTNRLQWGRDRAAFARPEYLPWWNCWEAEGWVSLGRVANFDWMHVQAARHV